MTVGELVCLDARLLGSVAAAVVALLGVPLMMVTRVSLSSPSLLYIPTVTLRSDDISAVAAH